MKELDVAGATILLAVIFMLFDYHQYHTEAYLSQKYFRRLKSDKSSAPRTSRQAHFSQNHQGQQKLMVISNTVCDVPSSESLCPASNLMTKL